MTTNKLRLESTLELIKFITTKTKLSVLYGVGSVWFAKIIYFRKRLHEIGFVLFVVIS